MKIGKKIFESPATVFDASDPCLLWAGAPDQTLKDSLATAGQIAPVLAVAMGTGEDLILVAGHARVAALKELGLPVLWREVRAEGADRGLLYLADNGHRAIDDPMRLIALEHFVSFGDEAVQGALVFLGVRPGSRQARELIAWLGLPETWRAHCRAGRVPVASSSVLSRVDAADLGALEPFFSHLSWSRSSAVGFLTALYETGRARGTGVAEIGGMAELRSLLDADLSPKDAQSRLLTTARTLRSPHLSELRRGFEGAARELSKGTPWRLAQPDNFETGGVDVAAKIKSADDLRKAADALRGLADDPKVSRLFGVAEDK